MLTTRPRRFRQSSLLTLLLAASLGKVITPSRPSSSSPCEVGKRALQKLEGREEEHGAAIEIGPSPGG